MVSTAPVRTVSDPARYPHDTLQQVELPIYGFLRIYEAYELESRLSRAPGVADVTVDPITEVAWVEYDSTLADVPALVAAIQRAGYRTR